MPANNKVRGKILKNLKDMESTKSLQRMYINERCKKLFVPKTVLEVVNTEFFGEKFRVELLFWPENIPVPTLQ